MDAQSISILEQLSVPAFVASPDAEVLFMNAELRGLLKARLTDGERAPTLVELGVFHNRAEYRGFYRGFTSVGPRQRIRLNSNNLEVPGQRFTLLAHRIGENVLGEILVAETRPAAVEPAPLSWRRIVAELPYYLLAVSPEGGIEYFNHLAERDLRPAASGGGGHLNELDIGFDDVNWRKAVDRARTEGSLIYETDFKLPDGNFLPVEVRLFDYLRAPLGGVILVAEDISARRNLSSRLQTALLQIERLEFEASRARELNRPPTPREGLPLMVMGPDSPYAAILEKVRQVAPTNATVLITGETGTGKELIARTVHEESPRSSDPMVVVNCGALPKELIESELFGYKKGAFTGAIRDQKGKFELADGGTLFLDEIGEMPLELQTRLLRFLQEGEVTPIGGKESTTVDVRVIAATNRDLAQLVENKTFRADLFFRLNVFPIHSIPLRQRRQDIPPLVDHFIAKHRRRLNSRARAASPAMLARLMDHPFFGNVRELENIVERAMITNTGPLLELDFHLPATERIAAAPVSDPRAASVGEEDWTEGFSLDFDEAQRRYIQRVLERTNGKVSGPGGAAEILRLKAQTLFSKMRKLGINTGWGRP